MWQLLKKFNKFLCCFYSVGVIHAGTSGEYVKELDFTPSDVWCSFDNGGGSVCSNDQDGFDVKIVPNGFVVVVTLGSDKRTVRWVAFR